MNKLNVNLEHNFCPMLVFSHFLQKVRKKIKGLIINALLSICV